MMPMEQTMPGNRAQRRAFARLFKKKYTKKGYLRGVKLNPSRKAYRLRRRNRDDRNQH